MVEEFRRLALLAPTGPTLKASVQGPYNAVWVKGVFGEDTFYYGWGAGHPTGVAVVTGIFAGIALWATVAGAQEVRDDLRDIRGDRQDIRQDTRDIRGDRLFPYEQEPDRRRLLAA